MKETTTYHIECTFDTPDLHPLAKRWIPWTAASYNVKSQALRELSRLVIEESEYNKKTNDKDSKKLKAFRIVAHTTTFVPQEEYTVNEL